jgi:hypothetical protein
MSIMIAKVSFVLILSPHRRPFELLEWGTRLPTTGLPPTVVQYILLGM